jgi:serine/threonine protein kinase
MPTESNLLGGKYRLLERIGEGSMGSVWKAMHETLERPFAVKFLKDYEVDSVRLEDRFLAEARVSAAVRHRCIVDVVDFGRSEEGTPYMVMELLEGASLGWRLMQSDPPPVLEVLSILQQALAGLEAVHRAGIVHRDLKPENIVLVCDEGEIVAKVIDFGISRSQPTKAITNLTGRGTASGLRLTMPGTTVGTPWYMAPEQAQALPTMDHRVDIYAAGVILYEACAGQLPFEHEDMHMLLLLVAAGGARPLSVYRPDLPASLSDAVARAMDPDPEARYASAAEFAATLREVAREISADALCLQRRDAFSAVAREAASRPTPHSFVAEPPAPVAQPALAPSLVFVDPGPGVPGQGVAGGAGEGEAIAAGAAAGNDEPEVVEASPSALMRIAPTKVGLPGHRVRGAILVPRAAWNHLRKSAAGQRPLLVASGAVIAAASLVLVLAFGGDTDAKPGGIGAHRSSVISTARATGTQTSLAQNLPTLAKRALLTSAPTAVTNIPVATATAVSGAPVGAPSAPSKRRTPRRPPEVFRTPGF